MEKPQGKGEEMGTGGQGGGEAVGEVGVIVSFISLSLLDDDHLGSDLRHHPHHHHR